MKNVRAIVLLSILAPVQGIRNADLAVQQEVSEHQLLDKLELPSKPMRNGTFLKQESLMEALAEIKTRACNRENTWKATGKEIGRGSNGKVIEVYKATYRADMAEKFALKEALSSSGDEEVLAERVIMSAASSCMNVMPVVDPTPCVVTGSRTEQLNYAYVSKKMAGDLWSWLIGADPDDRARCARSVAEQLSNGLTCLHEAGYIHGDFKADNVFYDQELSNGCPGGLRLADFGLSFKVGDYHNQYGSQYYAGSSHLVDSMFIGQSDTMELVDSKTRKFYGARRLDWCSYNRMMQLDFGMKMADLGYSATKSYACGYMGAGRRNYVYGNAKPTFSWR